MHLSRKCTLVEFELIFYLMYFHVTFMVEKPLYNLRLLSKKNAFHYMEKVYSTAMVWKCHREMSLGKGEYLLLWAICALN